MYVSEDQVFSEPILRDFQRETGVKVNAVFDTEEAKSTGVMNRLLAEKNNPQADVYWANEPLRADVLKQQGISASYKPVAASEIPDQLKDPEGHWTGFSARARLLVVNKSASIKPSGILAYVDPKTKGKGVIANPLLGLQLLRWPPCSRCGATKRASSSWQLQVQITKQVQSTATSIAFSLSLLNLRD